ncbi:hypothetical protein LZ30DRAFT_740538 [Colletotrichum cereale]|nr:hypothetical protein LZ30DRAFT_740538 [Colletotrichum cereale]
MTAALQAPMIPVQARRQQSGPDALLDTAHCTMIHVHARLSAMGTRSEGGGKEPLVAVSYQRHNPGRPTIEGSDVIGNICHMPTPNHHHATMVWRIALCLSLCAVCSARQGWLDIHIMLTQPPGKGLPGGEPVPETKPSPVLLLLLFGAAPATVDCPRLVFLYKTHLSLGETVRVALRILRSSRAFLRR